MSAAQLDGGTAAGDGFWEPWAFEPGDRVEIRLNGECEFNVSDNLGHGTDARYAEAFRNGMAGTVTHEACWPTARKAGHRYVVKWDGVEAGGWYAAAELVPLAADDDAAQAGDGRR
jgi:hypothetical protein